MNKIQQMIEELCPEGVEYVKLGEVCESICSGGTPSRSNSTYYSGKIPWLRTQEVDWNEIFDTSLKITQEAVDSSSAKLIPTDCVIIAMYGATAGKACINKIPLTTNQACCNLHINADRALYKYIYYWIANNYQRIKNMGEGSQNNLNAQKIKALEIPLPPLSIQSEIVKILDKFSALQAELEAKLEAELVYRKRQYEYYRDRLIAGDAPPSAEGASLPHKDCKTPIADDIDKHDSSAPCSNIKWMKMGEVAYIPNERVSLDYIDIYIGVENLMKDKAGALMNTTMPQAESAIAFKEGDILIGNIRPYLRKLWHATCDGGTNGDVVLIRLNDEMKSQINLRYLYHTLASESFFEYDNKWAKGAKMPRGNKSKILEFPICVPPLSEQARIADILDRFEALTTSISEGLPAEIAARRQQYEYYRDKLLTFKRRAS